MMDNSDLGTRLEYLLSPESYGLPAKRKFADLVIEARGALRVIEKQDTEITRLNTECEKSMEEIENLRASLASAEEMNRKLVEDIDEDALKAMAVRFLRLSSQNFGELPGRRPANSEPIPALYRDREHILSDMREALRIYFKTLSGMIAATEPPKE